MAESTEVMLARIDERTKNMAETMQKLTESHDGDKKEINKLKERMTRQETFMSPLMAAAAAIFSVVVSMFVDPFKGQ